MGKGRGGGRGHSLGRLLVWHMAGGGMMTWTIHVYVRYVAAYGTGILHTACIRCVHGGGGEGTEIDVAVYYIHSEHLSVPRDITKMTMSSPALVMAVSVPGQWWKQLRRPAIDDGVAKRSA